MTTTPAPAVDTPQPPTLLLVDDEANILSSLRRLFRPQGYRVLTAESGDEALQLLAAEPIDLILSDMRMPGMTGAQLLATACERWPDTVRILLTGYADMSSTIEAINRGQIYRYVSKPWEDDDLKLLVRDALERKYLKLENERMTQTIAEQNEQLRHFNAELEARVQARTKELSEALAATDKAHRDLRQSYTSTVRVFCELIESRSPILKGHGRRVADLARNIARKLGVSDAEQQTLVLASMLHDMGKIGLPDELLAKSYSTLHAEERSVVMTHPARAETLLMGISPLREAAAIVRAHHEHFDGTGYPDGSAGLAIPRLARILAVANAFDSLQLGTMVGRTLSPKDALDFIVANRGKRYDPSVVDAFVSVGVSLKTERANSEQRLRPAMLKAGMVLARDLIHADGYLLLSKGFVVDDAIIEQLLRLERTEGRAVIVSVA
ncbi:two-component system response regulator [Parazoarcus communis]|uniref:Two-component system response regulator n=1 Tax=Parazoarcus communis TaxID=41977 RepID=A0A2U8H7X8_9RHOO|nr:HD domain-containing phosphohydrolase [Parazoarcus communis]AWI81680.1 two-component system response regulator [Parazoarcus communis]